VESTEKAVSRPEFQILSADDLDKLHEASLQILERTGVSIDCEEALRLLGDAGIDVSDPERVKMPASLVEQALKTVPDNVTLHTREGEPCLYLDLARLIDYLPNIDWMLTVGWGHGLPGEITDKVSLTQALLNTSKPMGVCVNNVANLNGMLEVCSIAAGELQVLKEKPFFFCTVEPVTPLVQGKDAVEKSLLCAELGIPNVIYSMPMAGATSPATFAGTLAVCSAEFLSHMTIVQLKNPGAPVIYGSMPNIMDMRTTIYPYGAPELNLMVSCLTQLSHYYRIPMWGTAGCTDAKIIGVQAGAELMYECLTSLLSGADFVHDTGLMDHATMISPELIVLMDEAIAAAKVLLRGIEISDETLALDLVNTVGPAGSFLAERHTMEHSKGFFVPTIADRSRLKTIKHGEERLNDKTKKILDTHTPRPLPEDVVREIKKVEESWFKELGLPHQYPKKEQ
jgi:trimethylamine--corrinoid protein Co-methyltransferase